MLGIAQKRTVVTALCSLLPLLFCVIAKAEPPIQPLTLLRTIRVPDVVGDFNVFAVDRSRNHLFVTADRHGTIEMFDLQSGDHLKTIGGVKEPHMLAFIPSKGQLWIGDAGASAIVILDASDFHEVSRISLPTAPTAGLYDDQTHTFYIQDDGVDSKLDYSTINVISVDTEKIVGKLRVDAANLESMALDHTTNRLFINIRDKKQIGVIDLRTMSLVQTWTIPDLNLNTPMELDSAGKRLFIAGRKPGKFYVVDTSSGKVVYEADCINIADHMVWDPRLKRMYITGSQGISIFKQIDADHYQKLAEFPTNGGKIGTFVPELNRFYIVHPKTDIDIAGLLVYHVNQ